MIGKIPSVVHRGDAGEVTGGVRGTEQPAVAVGSQTLDTALNSWPSSHTWIEEVKLAGTPVAEHVK